MRILYCSKISKALKVRQEFSILTSPEQEHTAEQKAKQKQEILDGQLHVLSEKLKAVEQELKDSRESNLTLLQVNTCALYTNHHRNEKSYGKKK